jgi:hypothetical protein
LFHAHTFEGLRFRLGSNEFALASGDFNRDGKLDLAVANISSNDFVVLLGN